MMKSILMRLSSFVMCVFNRVRGPASVHAAITANVFRFNQLGRTRTQQPIAMMYTVLQQRYRTTYNRWWSRPRTHHLYLVHMKKYIDSQLVDEKAAYYPSLCCEMWSSTHVPHRLAVRACMDLYAAGIQEMLTPTNEQGVSNDPFAQ